MVKASQLKEIIFSYLFGGNADKFVLDLSAASYNIHKEGDAEAVALVNKIESKLADLHTGCISKSDLRDFLRPLVNPFIAGNISISVVPMATAVNFAAAAVGMTSQAWAGFSGTSPAGESASAHHLVQGSR